MSRTVTEVRGAIAVDTTASTLGVDPSELVLVYGVSDEVSFTINGDDLVLAENGSLQQVLNADSVTVDSFQVEHLDNSNTEAVRVFLTLTAMVGSVTSTEAFQTTVVLRGSYE